MMQYICQDCGHQFDPGSEIKWTEAHGETFTGCPVCGGAYEETVPCRVCGRHYDPMLLCMDVCPDCLQEGMTYDKILAYLESRNYLTNFMMEEFFETPEPDRVSDKLKQALRELFLLARANDLLCGKRELLDHCIAYIKQDMEDFAEWLQEEVIKNE